MIQVAIAAIAISAKRIVYAEGSVKRRFFSRSASVATASSLIRCLFVQLSPCSVRPARRRPVPAGWSRP
jgi:hypothetical protein